MDNEKQFKHLTLKERRMIESGLEHGDTKKEIAARIGKDRASISKEINRHLIIFPPKDSHECAKYKICRGKKYHDGCKGCGLFEQWRCTRRDRTPGSCNGCVNFKYCKRERRIYNAEKAQKQYELSKTENRQGVNFTPEEFEEQKKSLSRCSSKANLLMLCQ